MDNVPFRNFRFAGLDDEESSYRAARFVVIPVPYDLTVSYVSGTRKGPYAIIEASTFLEMYDEELGFETCEQGIYTFPLLEVPTTGPEAMIDRVNTVCSSVLKDGKIPVMLGGEHSISLGLAKSLKDIYPDLSVLQFDAHADLRDSYEGSPYSHACVGRRISEICPLVQVGIRSHSKEEADFMKDSDVVTVYSESIHENPNNFDFVDKLTDNVFVTIDLDGLDPSIMPAVGTPEPGGLGWFQVMKILREVSKRKNIVGFDLVELCPLPGNVAPDFLAAKLAYRLMGYISQNKN